MKILSLIVFLFLSHSAFAINMIDGTKKNDVLKGTAKTDDLIKAYEGDDILYSFGGKNELRGDSGSDFYYHVPQNKWNHRDLIIDDPCEANFLICKFPDDEKYRCQGIPIKAGKFKGGFRLYCARKNEGIVSSSVVIYPWTGLGCNEKMKPRWRISCGGYFYDGTK